MEQWPAWLSRACWAFVFGLLLTTCGATLLACYRADLAAAKLERELRRVRLETSRMREVGCSRDRTYCWICEGDGDDCVEFSVEEI